MGRRDDIMAECYKKYISKAIDLENVKNIAWLGWAGENAITKEINDQCPNLEKFDLYDYNVSQNPDQKVIKWDINEEWNISGYDLVICLRTSLFAKNASHFASQLGKATASNKALVFDFMLPELRFLTNYGKVWRDALSGQFGMPPGHDTYISWIENRLSGEAPENEELNKHLKNDKLRWGGWSTSHQMIWRATKKTLEYRIKGEEYGSNGYTMIPKFDKIYAEFFPEVVGMQYDKDRISYVSRSPDVFLTEEMLTAFAVDMHNVEFYYALNLEPPEHLSVFDAIDLPERWCFTLAVLRSANKDSD